MSWFGSEPAALEVAFAEFGARITDTGFGLDVPRAQALSAAVDAHAAAASAEVQRLVPPLRVETIFVPKRNNKVRGYVKGVPVIKAHYAPFNPNSSKQIIERIYGPHDYVPPIFTDSGNPSTSAAVLGTLDWPEAKAIATFRTDNKIQTMLTGPSGWLNIVSPEGRIHTSYNTMGTVTHRCSHSPNIAQVPKVRKNAKKEILKGPAGHWGWDCRACFIPPAGWKLVGIDIASLELCMLAHALAPWDGGAYALIVRDKPHEHNAAAIGGNTTREQAKTFIYAMIYGGGDQKLGSIIEPDMEDDYVVRSIGKEAKEQLIANITGFADLFRWLDSFNSDFIPALDGRTLYVRKKHARLNVLLQGNGSIISKRWALLTDAALEARGLRHGDDFQICCHVHDEMQIAARTQEIAEIVATVGAEMVTAAGLYYELQCPMSGSAQIGENWADTHG